MGLHGVIEQGLFSWKEKRSLGFPDSLKKFLRRLLEDCGDRLTKITVFGISKWYVFFFMELVGVFPYNLTSVDYVS